MTLQLKVHYIGGDEMLFSGFVPGAFRHTQLNYLSADSNTERQHSLHG